MRDHTYTVEISRELAEQYTEWTPVRDLRVDWFKIVPRPDGRAVVLFSVGDEPPVPA